jgi:translation initiation factor 3 subunit C
VWQQFPEQRTRNFTMSRFFQQGDSSSESESSDEEELYSDDSGNEEQKAEEFSDEQDDDQDDDDSDSDDSDDGKKTGANKFLKTGDSDSESESGSDEERVKTVKSAKDKRLEELEASIKAIENGQKINDWGSISTGILRENGMRVP